VSVRRVVLISRRFWPLLGGAESVMANLGEELVRQGIEVTLLTARFDRRWPTEVTHRGMKVVRLFQPQTRWWGTWCYMRAVARWLQENRERFDLAYVSMFKHDAYAAVSVGKKLGFPVAIRAEGAGLTGDMHWQLGAVGGRRIKRRCFEAAAFIAPSLMIHREIVAAGYPRGRIHYLPNGVALPAEEETSQYPAPQATRDAARHSLEQALPQLAIPDGAPLALYTGRLHHAKGLDDLVRAWAIVVEQYPNARLWIAGEGEYSTELEAQIRECGLEDTVVLAGAFDTVDELLTAADVFVLPSHEEGMSLSLLEAMAVALPVVASDIPGNRNLVDHEKHGLLVPPGEAEPLAEAIARLFADRDLGAHLGREARDRVAAEFSLEIMGQRHLDLFNDLLSETSSA